MCTISKHGVDVSHVSRHQPVNSPLPPLTRSNIRASAHATSVTNADLYWHRARKSRQTGFLAGHTLDGTFRGRGTCTTPPGASSRLNNVRMPSPCDASSPCGPPCLLPCTCQPFFTRSKKASCKVCHTWRNIRMQCQLIPWTMQHTDCCCLPRVLCSGTTQAAITNCKTTASHPA